VNRRYGIWIEYLYRFVVPCYTQTMTFSAITNVDTFFVFSYTLLWLYSGTVPHSGVLNLSIRQFMTHLFIY